MRGVTYFRIGTGKSARVIATSQGRVEVASKARTRSGARLVGSASGPLLDRAEATYVAVTEEVIFIPTLGSHATLTG